jgi:hypothetical protein
MISTLVRTRIFALKSVVNIPRTAAAILVAARTCRASLPMECLNHVDIL